MRGNRLNREITRLSSNLLTGTVLHSRNGDLALDPTIPILYSDPSGDHVIANDLQHFKRMKHIDIAHFFLRDKVADGRLTIALIQSSENLADIMTKPLTAPTLLHLRQLFGLTVPRVFWIEKGC